MIVDVLKSGVFDITPDTWVAAGSLAQRVGSSKDDRSYRAVSILNPTCIIPVYKTKGLNHLLHQGSRLSVVADST